MLQTIINEMKQIVIQPGFWAIVFCIHAVSMVLNLLTLDLGGACYRLLGMIITSVLYIAQKVTK